MSRLLAVAACIAMLAVAAPAAAHPSGAPPIARVQSDGSHVVLTWTAAADDWSALAASLGALPRTQTFAADGDGGVEQVGGPTVAQRLARAPQLPEYLRRNLVVLQGDTVCSAREIDTSSPVKRGAVVHYECPQAVDTVTVQVTMLHDIDASYRALIRTEAGDATFVTAQRPAAVVAVDATTQADSLAPPQPLSGNESVDARLLDMFDRAAAPTTVVLATLLAFAAGVLHALAPGHGKTIAAAATVARRGRWRHAAGFGVAVAAMHTASAAVVAVSLVVVDTASWLDLITGWLSVAAGAAVAVVGMLLLRRSREHEHEHLHEQTGRTMRSLGLSTGLVPSPTALLLLVAGLLSGRGVLALTLIAFFGIGMATTITLAGTMAGALAVRARTHGGVVGRLGAASPRLGAAGVTAAGLFYAASGARVLL